MSDQYQSNAIQHERNMLVSKSNDMVQKARQPLSIQEQRIILYAISKVQPADTKDTEYSFDLKDFYKVCGIKKDSYTATKQILQKLADKSWYIKVDGKESLVRWFNTLDCIPASDKVLIKFHERMMPYLVDLAKQGAFYTSYKLQYVLPMTSRYSPRLYELLKSYQKNNLSWTFDVEDLKMLMDCQMYERWADFRRFALEPAIREINQYSDIVVEYRTLREGKKIAKIAVFFDSKTEREITVAHKDIDVALDGMPRFFRELANAQDNGFVARRMAAHQKEQEGSKKHG